VFGCVQEDKGIVNGVGDQGTGQIPREEHQNPENYPYQTMAENPESPLPNMKEPK
jgi:hypothetical protein